MRGIAFDIAFNTVAALLCAGGLALIVVGVLGWRRRLPRNRFAGVRTVNTLRDEQTFAVGNQVGAPLSIAAGAIAVTLIVLATLGTLGLTVAGGVLGDRAASRMPLPESGCSGTCAGCSLVAGCTGSELRTDA
jgi:hypothetical protein